MNLIQKTVAIALLLFSATEAAAQDVYSDPYSIYNGYGPSGYGRRKNMPLTDTSKLSKESKDKLREETIAKTVEKLKTRLNLDELQVIVITNTLIDSQKKQVAIAAKEDSEENKALEQQATLDATDRQIMSFLTKDQKEKFTALLKER